MYIGWFSSSSSCWLESGLAVRESIADEGVAIEVTRYLCDAAYGVMDVSSSDGVRITGWGVLKEVSVEVLVTLVGVLVGVTERMGGDGAAL